MRANTIDTKVLAINVAQAVSLGQLLQLEHNAHYLADLVGEGALTKQCAVDILQTAAAAADLPGRHGTDCIQEIIASGFEVAA